MAVGFLVCVAPDSHIAYLREHPGFVHDYIDGTEPKDSGLSSALPPWWPKQAPDVHGSWSVNHRNADLYHWILNHAPTLVTGAGAIFQAWYEPDHSDVVIKLDGHNERFALSSDKIAELSALVAGVTLASVRHAFVEWCKSQGKNHEDIDDYACEPFVEEFQQLREMLVTATRNGDGIIW